MTFEQDISIGAITVRKGLHNQFLILKRTDNGIWDFPKGHPTSGEHEEDTLRREIKEELGISRFSVIPQFKHQVLYQSSRGVHRVMIFYLIQVVDEITLSNEHSEARWITLVEVPLYFKYQDVLELLKKCACKLIEFAETESK